MIKSLKTIKHKGSLFVKLLFVALIFVMLVVFTCLYVSNLLHSHLTRDATDMLANAKLKIESELFTPKTALNLISQNIDDLIINGGGEDAVLKYMRTVTEYMKDDEIMQGFSAGGVYGYFTSFGSIYLDGTGWSPPGGYDPTSRPWYMPAVDADGSIITTEPYVTPDTKFTVITYAQSIYDGAGNLLGVVCIDMPLGSISGYITGLKLTENGYGFLTDENLNFIAHPEPSLIGKNARDIKNALLPIADDIISGVNVFDKKAVNYDNKKIIIYMCKLDNGWFLGITTPQGEYYRELTKMVLILSILGGILAVILMIILVRIDIARQKSDEENQRKTIKLIEMEKTREADEYAQIMFDATPIGCTLFDKNCNRIACNAEIVKLFELSSKQEFLERFFELSPEYQPCGKFSRDMAAEYIQKAFDDGYCRLKWMHRKLNGELIPSEIILVRVNYKREYAVAGYTRDLREIKQTLDALSEARENAEAANKAKSAFLANMSHEMRTPLNVIIGLSDLKIEDENLPVELRDDVRKINSAGTTLLGIVNDVLDFSKIEAGRLELTPVEYTTASLLNDIITLNMIRIEGKPIEFKLDISEELFYDLYGDDLRVTQIFNNLLSNAFKYTKQGSVTLTVGSVREKDSDVWLSITVSDTGIGIKEDDLKKLFSEYNQVDTKANRKIEGTGLGLSITKRMVEFMGGTITVESEYGKGTSFHVCIRQGYVNDRMLGKMIVENLCSFKYTDRKQHITAKIVRPDLSYARVLVVDDFPTNLDVASGMLKKYKMQVDCVTSGYDAIERIKQGEPVYNAVFMDHMMPGMDGIEATKLIRGMETEYAKNIPIIALTANAIAGNEKMFLENGFSAFLSKPIDLMRLDEAVKKWIAKSQEENKSDEQAVIDSNKQKTSQIINIQGIDTEKGLSLYDGDTELYLSVIRSYAVNTPAILDKLRNVTAENLRDYDINVHGLKGSSANIGAEEVRQKALDMELKAKDGDLPAVLAGNDDLLNDAGTLVTAVREWLSEHDANGGKPKAHAPDKTLLSKLRQYCEQFNIQGIDEVIAQLESTDYETGGDMIQTAEKCKSWQYIR